MVANPNHPNFPHRNMLSRPEASRHHEASFALMSLLREGGVWEFDSEENLPKASPFGNAFQDDGQVHIRTTTSVGEIEKDIRESDIENAPVSASKPKRVSLVCLASFIFQIPTSDDSGISWQIGRVLLLLVLRSQSQRN
jgi:hypothetical protein